MGEINTTTFFYVVKQNLSYVGSHRPPALGKLTHTDVFVTAYTESKVFLSPRTKHMGEINTRTFFYVVKQNLSYVRTHRPPALEKLTLTDIFVSA